MMSYHHECDDDVFSFYSLYVVDRPYYLHSDVNEYTDNWEVSHSGGFLPTCVLNDHKTRCLGIYGTEKTKLHYHPNVRELEEMVQRMCNCSGIVTPSIDARCTLWYPDNLYHWYTINATTAQKNAFWHYVADYRGVGIDSK